MRNLQTFKRTALALLLVALLSLFSLSSALADEDKSAQEKIAKLEAMINDLESLVKSLTIQVQRVSEEVVSDLENFRPRLFTIEKLTKDNTFELKKLSGTVAELSDQVEALSKLPEEVAQLKASVAELSSRLTESEQALSSRIGANELAISKLQDSVERTLIVTEDFKENLGSIFARLAAAEDKLKQLQEQTGGLQVGLEGLSAHVDSSLETLSTRLGDLEAQIGALQDGLAQIKSLSEIVSQMQAQLAELAAHRERMGARMAQLKDILQQLSEQVKANTTQLEEHASRLEAIEAQIAELEEPDLKERVDRLANKIAEVLIEVESTRQMVDELQQALATVKDEVKREVLAAVQVPSAEEIRLQIEEIAAKQIKQAKARADAAQGLAMVALLAGMAAIAVALLLP